MVMDANGMSHKPAGTVGGGQFENKADAASDDDLEQWLAAPATDDDSFEVFDDGEPGEPGECECAGHEGDRERSVRQCWCRRSVCVDCSWICADCGRIVCRDCSLTCELCRNWLCGDCAWECAACDRTVCEDCAEGPLCADCDRRRTGVE